MVNTKHDTSFHSGDAHMDRFDEFDESRADFSRWKGIYETWLRRKQAYRKQIHLKDYITCWGEKGYICHLIKWIRYRAGRSPLRCRLSWPCPGGYGFPRARRAIRQHTSHRHGPGVRDRPGPRSLPGGHAPRQRRPGCVLRRGHLRPCPAWHEDLRGESPALRYRMGPVARRPED